MSNLKKICIFSSVHSSTLDPTMRQSPLTNTARCHRRHTITRNQCVRVSFFVLIIVLIGGGSRHRLLCRAPVVDSIAIRTIPFRRSRIESHRIALRIERTMKFSKKIVVVATFLAAAAGRAALAYSNIGARGGTSRRQLFQKAASASAAAAAAAFLPQAEEAQAAVEACLPQSQNCIRTTWTPPVGTSKADVAQALQDALTSYPQQGQQGADNAGWTVVQDDLLKGGKARIEYKNFGTSVRSHTSLKRISKTYLFICAMHTIFLTLSSSLLFLFLYVFGTSLYAAKKLNTKATLPSS